MIELDADQRADIRKLAADTSGAALIASTPGAGKTVVALASAYRRSARTIVVMAPLGTRTGWRATAEAGWRWADGTEESYADLPFYWIRNHKEGHEAMARLQFREPGIYFVGSEYATSLAWKDTGKRNAMNKPIKVATKFWNSITPDALIVDEVHRGAVKTSNARHKFYASLNAEFKMGLSGTPAGQNFEGIYGVTKFLWPDHVPATLQAFKTKYCDTEYDHFAWDHMKVIREKNPGAYFASLPCVVRRVWVYDGVIDKETVWVELSAPQRKAYRDLEERMVTMIEGDPFVIEFPSTLRTRLRQASLGMFKLDEEGSLTYSIECKSTKLDALKRVIADDFAGESALILTDSKRFAKVTVERIKGWGATAEEYSGDIKDTERDAIKARFISGETRYVVMVIKAGGTGINMLQSATRNVAWLSQDDSSVENLQALARVVRRGQGDLVRVRYILALGTYDQGVMSADIQRAIAMNKSYRVRA